MDDYNNILIIRLSSFGDILLASPLIRVVRKAYPQARIDFLVKAEYTELLRYNPHISHIIEFQAGGQKSLWPFRRTLHQTRYDLILDLHNSLRSRVLRALSGAKTMVVDKRIPARSALIYFKKNLYGNVLSVADRYLETIKPFGIPGDGEGLELFFPDATSRSTTERLRSLGVGDEEPLLALAPTARHATKMWLPERFAEFAINYLETYGGKALVLGSAGERDYCERIALTIAGSTGQGSAINAAGEFTLLETAAALDRCTLVVSNDSGIMHLAAARRKKIVAVFGSTVQEFGFAPYRVEHAVVERTGLACRPCTHIGRPACPQGHFKCMNEIQTGDVLKAARSLLTSTVGHG